MVSTTGRVNTSSTTVSIVSELENSVVNAGKVASSGGLMLVHLLVHKDHKDHKASLDHKDHKASLDHKDRKVLKVYY